MPIYKDTLLTERGYEVAIKAANGQGSFTITRTVSSDNQYSGKSDNELRQLTRLDNEIEGAMLDQNIVNTKMTSINTQFTNELVTGGYKANTIGLYAKEASGDEFLYAVTPSTSGQLIPEQTTNVFSGFQLIIYVLVGNVQKMELNLSPGGDATIDYVNKAVSKCRDELLALINQKENIFDHDNDIKKLRSTINDDIQPKLDKKVSFDGGKITTGFGTFVPAAIGDVNDGLSKKENITDHNNDVNKINDTLKTKVTFNGGNITTGNGTFVPAAIGEVNKVNDYVTNVDNNTLKKKPVFDGIDMWGIAPGFYEFNNTLVLHNPYSDSSRLAGHAFVNANQITYYDQAGSIWRLAPYSGTWLEWTPKKEFVNLQNQVNGVLARQTNLIQKIISQNHLSGVSLLESLLDQDVGITIKVNDSPLIYIKLGTSQPVLFLSGTLLITSGTTSYSISNLDQSIKSYLAGKQGWLNDLHYLNGQSTSVGVYISKDGNWINFTGRGGYIQSSGTAPLS